MSHFKNVLVVIDPTEDDSKALSRALELSSKQAINITLFLSIYDFSYEMTTMLSSDERHNMRDAVIADRTAWLKELIDQNVNANSEAIKTKVVWHNRPYESILKEVVSGDFDLVIKGTHSHDTLKSVIFTPTDWHLLRKCPTSLLLVKEHAWPSHGKVLAAVSAGSEDEKHQELNNLIIENAITMADLLESDTHLMNAYPPTPVNIAVEIPEFDPNEYNATMKDYHIKSMDNLANQHQVPNTRCHVVEGMAEDVIPRIAKDLDAELVVMGTVGRQGITAALIGNTAEHVIDNINCDLLAIKPSDFECPIKP
ncbi:universal stress protein UspE [Psychrosphaera sp.]|nr:universal stress protein UspE [Psychrosphaera sp.]